MLSALVLALVIAVLALWARVSDQAQRLRALEEQLEALQMTEAARRLSQATATAPHLRPPSDAGAADQPAPAPAPPPPRSGGTPFSELSINFLTPDRAGRSRPTPSPAPPQTAPRSVWGGQPFAVLGGLLTLLGLGAVLSQLVRAGVFTPEVQLAAAFALAAALYALAERARPVVGAVLRGLGYGIAALAFGAMFQAGALPVLAVLGLTGLLSLLVGWHAWQRREPLTLLVALGGATLATWLLADDLAEQLGTLGTAQLALSVVFAAALWSLWRSRQLRLPTAARWLLMGGLGVLGLTVTAQAPGSPAEQSGKKAHALHAAAIVSLALTAAAALLFPVGERPLLPSALGLWLVTLAALGWRVRQFPQLWTGRQPDVVRNALVLAALALAASLTERWLTAGLDMPGQESWAVWRLLPYALLAAVYGHWSGSRTWQRGGAGLGALLLLEGGANLERLGPQVTENMTEKAAALLGTLAALGAALRLSSAGSAALLLAAAAFLPLRLLQGDPAPLLPLLGTLALAVWAGTRWQGRLLWFAAWTLGPGLLMALLHLLTAAAFPMFSAVGEAAWAWLYLSVAAGGLLALSLAPNLRTAWTTLGAALRLDLNRAVRWLEVGAVSGWLLGTALFLHTWLGREETALLLTGVLAALLVPLLTRLPLRSERLLPRLLLSASLLAALCAAPLITLNERESLSLGSGWLAWVAACGALVWASRAPQPQPLLALPGWGLLLLGSALAQGFGGLLTLSLGLAPDRLAAHLIATGLLILAGLAGLLWAYRSEQRQAWWVGLTLFGLGAGKLVLLDLDGLGVSARGLGLTLIGLLLLWIGQLAPAEEEGAAEGEQQRA